MTVFAVMCAGIFPLFHVGGFGLRGGYSLYQTLMLFGHNFEVLLNGMFSQYPLTLQFPYCFGTWA